MAEACLGAAYCNGDDVTSRYEAEELNKLRNPSRRCLRDKPPWWHDELAHFRWFLMDELRGPSALIQGGKP
eukprot:scaffold7636_cov126-Skeletonema_dohrnii-CCMP3373.AAC.1